MNFLDVLNAGCTTHLVNEAALAYMREHDLAHTLIAQLSAQPRKSFADRAGWTAHLNALGIVALAVQHDPVRIATEGALWGVALRRGRGRLGGHAPDGVLPSRTTSTAISPLRWYARPSTPARRRRSPSALAYEPSAESRARTDCRTPPSLSANG